MLISDSKLQKKINFFPRESQQSILNCQERETVINAGRRFGKSAICAYMALKMLLEPNRKIWIVAPTYDLSQKIFEYVSLWFMKAAPSQRGGVSYRPNPRIRTAGGSILECKSTENPKGLLGEELDLLIVDEAAQVPKNIWEQYLFPTTSSRKGRSVFISTPFGKNWFYHKAMAAKDNNAYFHFTSADNPQIAGEEWERARQLLPESAFKQNYLATFLDDAASVFRGVRGIIGDTLRDVDTTHKYVIGVDLGKYNDFTVLTVLDTYTHKVVHFDRFQQIDWNLQKARIVALSKRYMNARVMLDSTGLGDPIADDLRRDRVVVDDVKFSNKSKQQLVEKLQLFIEQKSITIPDKSELIDELEAFGYELTDAGNIRFGAPQGMHDDCVISLALAVWGLDDTKTQQASEQYRQEKKRIIYQFK